MFFFAFAFAAFAAFASAFAFGAFDAAFACQLLGLFGINSPNISARILGLVSLVIPFLGSMGSCGPFVDAVCDMRCDYNQCTDVEKQAPCLARLEIWRHPEVAWWLSFGERKHL